jgi:hypothetical protein
VAESAATDVAVVGSIGKFTDADAVEDDPDYTFEDGHLTSLRKSGER